MSRNPIRKSRPDRAPSVGDIYFSEALGCMVRFTEAGEEEPWAPDPGPYASIDENRAPAPEELDAFMHADDPPDPRPLIDPMHGPYDKLPRDENGRIHPYYLCTREEIEAFGLTEPPRRHRQHGWTREQMADFIDTVSTTASVSAACAYVGKSRMAAYRLRNRADAAHFRAAWNEALRAATQVLADTAYERAVEGVKKTIWYQGEPVGEETVYNDRLLMFLLRVRDPHGYAPIDQLDRAQRLRPLEVRRRLEATLDKVETSEEEWRRALEAPARGGSPAVEMLDAPPHALDALDSLDAKPGTAAALPSPDGGDGGKR